MALARRESVGEHRVDVILRRREPHHLGTQGSKLLDRDIDENALELRELRAGVLLQHLLGGRIGERRENADDIFGLRTGLESLHRLGEGCGIGLRLPDLLRDGVHVVREIDARIIGRIRFRHFLRAVAQAHDARRRTADQGFGQGEEGLAMPVARIDGP